MRLALSGLLFDQAPAADFAAAAREIGYAGVELRGTRHQLPPDADATRLDLLRELFEGLEIVNIASHAGNFALLDEAEALAARQTAHRFLEWAAALGARSVRVWPGWVAAPEAEPEHWARASRHLRWCADAAADLGVMVAIEMHHGSLAESAAGANRLLDEVDRPSVGLILDPANLMQTPAPFGPRAVGPIWDRLLHVHVKDHSIVSSTELGAYPFRLYLAAHRHLDRAHGTAATPAGSRLVRQAGAGLRPRTLAVRSGRVASARLWRAPDRGVGSRARHADGAYACRA